jgi:hypothetical protein
VGPISVPLSNGIAMTWLYVNDYAAWGSVRATIPTSRTTTANVSIRIPLDTDANLLADAGWPSKSGWVDSRQFFRGDEVRDLDSKPSGPNQLGDGLSAFEEYRGFVVGGNHARLNPSHRDLFVDADPTVPLELVNQLPAQIWLPNEGETKGVSTPRTTTNDISGQKQTQLERISPVINPNRTDVPGARALGQHGIRLISQTVAPVKQYEAADGSIRYYEAWMVRVAGLATPNTFNDVNTINVSTNQVSYGSPNETRFVEVFPDYFKNNGIVTSDFANHHDVHGDLVPNCAASANPNAENCDDWIEVPITVDSKVKMIVPHPRPTGVLGENYFQLHTVLNTTQHPGDYYSKKSKAYSVQPFNGADYCYEGVARALPVDDINKLQAAAAAHEVMHALTSPHSAECGSLMLDATLTDPFGDSWKANILDLVPIPDTINTPDMEKLRLWQP